MMLATKLQEAAANSTLPTYIEDVFSTYLYTGNGSTQTITNGIDLSGKGGMVWTKSRTSANEGLIYDTARGVNKYIIPSSTQESQTSSGTLTAFNIDGFTLGSNDNSNDSTTENSVGWTFRKQPKFFDVVTYTGDGTTNRSIAHNLGSMPGFIAIKRTDSSGNWACAARYDDNYWYAYYEGTGTRFGFNSTDAGGIGSASAMATSTVFYPRLDGPNTNATAVTNINGATYVAYLFAHNAGGFGLTGTDNVISCGSYTGTGSDMSVTLGYEPQYVMIKRTDSTGDWWIGDTMRGFNLSGVARLEANTSDAEAAIYNGVQPTSTGFFLPSGTALNGGGDTFIYIAIRRGPMKVPTSGTSVFSPLYFTGDDSTSRQLTSGFPVDTFLGKRTVGDTSPFVDRLRGKDLQLYTSLTNAEATGTNYCRFDSSVGPIVGYNASGININSSAYNYRTYSFRRAPSFFDVVCYTGNGVSTGRAINHNLGVVPELMIIKWRNGSQGWYAYSAPVGNERTLFLNLTDAVSATSTGYWYNTTPTSTVFTLGSGPNQSSRLYVAYLFATCAGVSKVFSYTGNGSSQTINCGFTSGARFVLIKRTDSTGNWYVWDTARGIVSGNDAYFELNLSDAEVTSNDTIDTNSTGFVVNQVSATNVNVSSATYIGIAIA